MATPPLDPNLLQQMLMQGQQGGGVSGVNALANAAAAQISTQPQAAPPRQSQQLNPAQVVQQLAQAGQPQAPQMKMRLTGLPGLLINLFGHHSGATGAGDVRPVSRADAFENFLGDFIYSVGQGFQQMGRGPGANARGFGAAVQAPMQRDIMQAQLGQQLQAGQAGIQETQAKTALAQAQAGQMSNTVMTPYGPMSQGLAAKVWPAAIGAGAKTDVANIGAGAKIAAAEIAQGIDPKTGQSITGKSLGDFGATGAFANLPPSKQNIALWNAAQKAAGKTSTRQVVIQTADGQQIINLSSTSRPNLPGGGTPGAPKSGFGGGGKGPVAKPILDAQGNPVQPQLTSTTRTMKEAAPKVLEFVDRIRTLVQQQQKTLGPAMSRWNEFMAGKVGAPNAEFTALRTNVGLMQTLLMRMHVGARGSEYMMKHFNDLLDSSKQSPENMLSALNEIEAYAKNVQGTGQSGVVRYSANGKTYSIPAAQEKEFLKDNPAARKF